MRQCIKCKQFKEVSEFNFKNLSRGIRQSQCRFCTRNYVKDHYYKNKTYYLAKARKRNDRIRRSIKDYTWEYLNKHNCVDCGEKDPIVLEFDHMRDKSFTIASNGRNRTLKQVQNEITKCEVRCANCHRRKTFKQFGWHKESMPL